MNELLLRLVSFFASISVLFSAMFPVLNKDLTHLLDNTDTYKVYCSSYSQVKANGSKVGMSIRSWRDGFVTGNGENGCVNAGSPYSDTIIYQNNYFVMPCDTLREAPDISGNLDEVRQMIVRGESYKTNEPWHSVYCFHPAGQLRLTQSRHIFNDYVRWCDYETGEVGVKYTDINGSWDRRTFTSRTDNATITRISQSSTGKKINMTVSFDDISKMYNFGNNAEEGLIYKKLVGDDAGYIAQVAHYPVFEGSELANGGYATLTYVITCGGTKERVIAKDSGDRVNVGNIKNPEIRISDADAVYLITVSDRDFNMGEFKDFAAAESYSLVDSLYGRCEAIARKYGGDNFDYSAALAPSAAEHGSLFRSVSFNLDGEESKSISNEQLICNQQADKALRSSMVERVYNAGRYAMICCSGGNLIGRLYGMWTGEWGARWNGAFTMDANVNLQCSGMNSANCKSYGESYIRFVLAQIEDWKTNALHNYGFTDAIQVPCNTDGTSAAGVEYSTDYSFEYWNNGASWMLSPIYEFYQSYGNVTVRTDKSDLRLLDEILLPLLKLQANFWEQMLSEEYYTDTNGAIHYQEGKTVLAGNEYYCILPSYSPENTPANRESGRAANSAADISAARKGFEMLVAVEKELDAEAYKDDIEKWERLSSKLPPYLFDESGALKEWAANDFEENNAHRHISHLYCAWPSNETQSNPLLAAACVKALENRNSAGNEGEETQTHGWLHKGLVGARLKDKSAVNKCLIKLLTSMVYYDSLMTDHNTHRGSDCYCTDTSLGIVGVINEMLLYSDTGVIEIFPALVDGLDSGEVKGLMAKTRAKVDIVWGNGKATVSVTSYIPQSITITCFGQARTCSFESGETKTFEFINQ